MNLPTEYMVLPTASKSSLVLSGCTHWIGKPHYEDKYADTTKRDIGTVVHAGCEGLLNGQSLQEATDECKEYMHSLWKGDVAGLRDADQVVVRMLLAADKYIRDSRGVSWDLLGTEVAVSYDIRTGHRIILDIVDREYPREGGFLRGTADIYGLNKFGAYIADWKTGGTDSARDQMMTLAAIMAPPGEGATICTLAFREEAGGAYKVNAWDEYVSRHDLDEHLDVMAKSLTAPPSEPRPGARCIVHYCPYLFACQATMKAVEEMYASDTKVGP